MRGEVLNQLASLTGDQYEGRILNQLASFTGDQYEGRSTESVS
jgi:hypothetical protein